MLNNEQFRKYAKQIADRTADYYKSDFENYRVYPKIKPGEIIDNIPDTAPAVGEDFEDILNDFEEIIMPGITHWQHPRFFGYFPSNTSYESMLGEFLAGALGVINFTWESSPAATELEQRVMQWLAEIIGLPKDFSGVIHDTASTASLCAVLIALNKITGGKWHEEGFDGRSFRLYCSNEAHSSIEKAAVMAGIGRKNVRKINTDENFAIRIEELRQAITDDIDAGHTPFCVVGALGTTGSLAVDPIDSVGDICKEFDLCYHIDAAYSGSLMALDEFAYLRKGLDKADSFVFNPHKQLFTNFDCSAFFVKDTDLLEKTFSIAPEYLRFDEDDRTVNYKDRGIQLGRKFRALKLWFVLRSFGVDGLKKTMRRHIEMTRDLLNFLKEIPGIEILAPVNQTLICFRLVKPRKDEDELNRLNKELLTMLNNSGEIFVTHTKLAGKYAIRLAVGKTYISEEDIKITKKVIKEIINKF